MKSYSALPYIKPVPDTGGIFTIDLGHGAFIPNVKLASCFVSVPTHYVNFDNFAHVGPLFDGMSLHSYPSRERVKPSIIGDHKYASRYDKVFWGIRDSSPKTTGFFFETEDQCRRFRDERQQGGAIIPYFCVNPSFPLFYREVFEFCIGACQAQIPNANETDSRSERNGYLAAIKDCIDAIKFAQESESEQK